MWRDLFYQGVNSIVITLLRGVGQQKKQKKVLAKKLELNSIKCAAAGFFKVLMVNNGFYNGKKINNLKNYILDKISVQMSFYYTQIEENSNIFGGMFCNFFFSSVFL